VVWSGVRAAAWSAAKFELIAVYLVVFFEHAVGDGGLDVDDVAFTVGEGEVEEGFAGDGIDADGKQEDLYGDVRAGGGFAEVDELGTANGGVGDAGDGVLVDDGVQIAGAGVAGEDVLAAGAGVDVAADLGGVFDSGGASD